MSGQSCSIERTEQWRYVGRRPTNRTGSLLHVFIDGAGETHGFSKGPKVPVVGALYELRMDDGGVFVQAATIVDSNRDAVIDKLDEWRLLDRSAASAVEHARAAKRLAKDNADFGALTLDQVRRTLSRQPYHVRAGTIAAILQYLGAA